MSWLASLLITVALVPGPPPPDRPRVLAGWTQVSAASYREWAEARRDRGAWKAYRFNWTTDQCTGVPERPAGFDFRLACERHDFGYRNYKAVGGSAFAANRARLDRAFRADMLRACGRHPVAVRALCSVVALTYYLGVRNLGTS